MIGKKTKKNAYTHVSRLKSRLRKVLVDRFSGILISNVFEMPFRSSSLYQWQIILPYKWFRINLTCTVILFIKNNLNNSTLSY